MTTSMQAKLRWCLVLGLAAIISLARAQSDPCSISCSQSQYQAAACVDPVSSILLDYNAGKTQPDIDVEGEWQEYPQGGGLTFLGYFGEHFYLLNRVRNTGHGMFSFTVDKEADYNISISYVYFADSPMAFTDSQRYDVYTDGALAGTFFIDQQQPPPDGNLTVLGQFHIVSSGYVYFNATAKDTSDTTVTASLDAVFVEPSDPDVAAGSPPTCISLRTCQGYEYETVAPTATSDRTCTLTTNCTAAQYQAVAPTPTTDRQCMNLTLCDAMAEFETAAPTATTDRECETLTTCSETQFEEIAPTPTSDRTCQECDECEAATQIVVANCTATSNAQCRNITESYQYSEWSEWSVSCGTQTRTRVETCADVKCLDPQPTTQTRDINGGCEDVCTVSNNSIVCSCSPPSYLINSINCSSVFCSVPTFANGTAVPTGSLKLDEQATVACDEGHASAIYGESFTLTCTEAGLLNDTATCEDIDECATNNGGCTDMCTNLPGTFCCSRDGVYTYSDWSDWSTTCGPGVRTRTRTCNATCGGECTNDLPLMDTRDICCPVNASYTYGPYPDWQAMCTRQTRERPESCSAMCGGVCTGRMNTTQVLVNGGCEQVCNATSGAIVCSCDPGNRLTADNTTCEAFNPCEDNNGGCSHTCVPGNAGQFECTCPAGFIANDGFNCEDVNECAANNGGCQQHCNNTAGSFFCSCMSGYMVDPGNSSSCVRVDCQAPPTTLPASAPLVTASLNGTGPFQFGDALPYVCADGYTVDGDAQSATEFALLCRASGMVDGVYVNGCVDVDECSTNNGGCSDTCVNFAGGFNCTCPAGYRLADGFSCEEIDECAEQDPCDQACTNTPGSFVCSCGTGFYLDTSDNTSCVRVSCGAPPSAQANATVGATAPGVAVYEDVVVYNCLDGYTTTGQASGSSFFFAVCQADGDLSPLVPTACYDVNECASSPCDQTCTNTLGSFSCSCGAGYTKTSPTRCRDINECERGDMCAGLENVMCVNTDGSFVCECVQGFTRHNGTCQQQVHDLLDPALSTAVGEQAPQRFADNWAYFNGSGAMEIMQPLVVSSTFGLSAQVQVAPGTGGYVLAVTSASGATRHFAIYIYELTQRLGVWYRTASDASSLALFRLLSPLDDGHLHNIVVNVDGQSISLQIDNSSMTYTQQLGAAISFCDPGPDCKIYVGQRASSSGSGAYQFEGIMRRLQLHTLSTTTLAPIEVYPDPSTAGPSAIDLLDASNRNVVGSITNDSTGALVFDGSSAAVVPRFHRVPIGEDNAFTVTLTALQVRGTSGYLVAKTNAVGGRYWSLYSSSISGRTSFFYRVVGASSLSSVHFPVSLSDGVYHRVMLSVSNTTARLYVDGSLVQEQTLAGLVTDCSPPSSSCVLQLGRRTDENAADGLYFFTGRIFDAVVYSGVSMTVDPTAMPPTPMLDQQLPTQNTSGLQFLDLLNDTLSYAVGNVVRSSDGVTLDGVSRLVITEHAFTLGPTLSVVGTLQATAGSTGYIFAKTSQDGSTRHLALYMSSLSRLTLYYTSSASAASRNILFFDVQLDDGVVHSFLLQLVHSQQTDTTAVNLYIDGKEQTQQSFAGQLTDCGARSASCGLAVGQRLDDNTAGGNFGMTGTLQLLQLFPFGQLALSDAPSVTLAGPPYFSVQQGVYIPGQNQGGAFRSGVTPDECARKCLDDDLCLSFDAGTVGQSQEGACFLSYVTATASGTSALVESPLFVYYEKL